MNYIELFAGCGGLSLGLKSVGFELVLANELSPMASETFAYNFFQENLAKQTPTLFNDNKSSKIKWLSSNFPLNRMQDRLREDPRTFLEYGQGFCDFSSVKDLKGNLLVGNIIEINKWLAQQPEYLQLIKSGFGTGEIDLVSGGPPCQSFSMAGMREFSNKRNTLPWEFAKFVKNIQPKIALLENVTGILRAFKVEGNSYYAWFEVAKSFAKIGYIPLCLHINAKYVGIAQNRPRFILLAIRHDIFEKIKFSFNFHEKKLFNKSKYFYDQITLENPIKYGLLPYFDINKNEDFLHFKHSFLKNLVKSPSVYTSVEEAIDDLRINNNIPSSYIKKLNKCFKSKIKSTEIKNHEYRKNTPLVKSRFRIYQILNKVSPATQREVKALLRSTIDYLSDTTLTEMSTYTYLNNKQKLVDFKNKQILNRYLIQHRTKKQTQKALISKNPAPTALSIADDTCHYHSQEIRTLTVREMARIQSFPDNFIFRSKVTTGGKMRRFEVPQYTQVGNAVPPLLGRALGLTVKNLLQKIPNEN
jgi:DNA (cytosine-5)-methyltransferase 1